MRVRLPFRHAVWYFSIHLGLYVLPAFRRVVYYLSIPVGLSCLLAASTCVRHMHWAT